MTVEKSRKLATNACERHFLVRVCSEERLALRKPAAPGPLALAALNTSQWAFYRTARATLLL